MAVTRKSLLESGERILGSKGVPQARRNAEWLLCDILGCTRAQLYAYSEELVGDVHEAAFKELVARRSAGEPIQYILGHTEFYGLRIHVTPDVLIPRPETEQVVDRGLELLRGRGRCRILDIGTGSGCIAVAIKHQRPDLDVFACDVSDGALAVARHNASANGVQVGFLAADVLSTEFPGQVAGPFHLIVSNPPYVRLDERDALDPEVRDFEPGIALFAGEDPLIFYRRIADHGSRLLKSGGHVLFETHAEMGAEAAIILESAGYEDVRLERDYSGRQRILHGRRR